MGQASGPVGVSPAGTVPDPVTIRTQMKVLKFGGSSLGSPARVRDVGRIVLDAHQREPVVVVVSAFQGVTNQLVECARLAEQRRCRLRGDPERHRETPPDSGHVPGDAASRPCRVARRDAPVGAARHHSRHPPPAALSSAGARSAASFGERLSAVIVAAHLSQSRPAVFVDSRQLVTTDDQFTHAAVNFPRTNRAIRAHFLAAPVIRARERRFPS